ncbi:MAG: 6-bladed beta-propeller [Candidatus Aminicenantaceae bacterium]
MKQRLPVILGILVLAYFSFGQESFQIGALGEEGELIFPRQIAEGPDGSIYVYDQSDAFIKVFSAKGRYLRKMGGEGQGPGEIQRSDGVSFGFTPDDELFFTEFFNGHPWFTVLDLSGKLVRVIKLDQKERIGVSSAESLPDGRFLTKFNWFIKPKQEKDYFYHIYPQQIVLLDPSGAVLSRSKKAEYISRISYASQGADAPIPFTPAFAWCPFQNDTLLFSDGLSTKLQVYDFEGKLVKEISTPLPEPGKVTNSDLNAWRDNYIEMMKSRSPDWFNRFGKVITNYKKSLYDKHPNLSELSLTPGGNIFITGARNEDNNVDTFWLLDSNGRELAAIKTGAQGVWIAPNFILYGMANEDDEVTVKALKRIGSEQEDLQRLGKLAPVH